LKKKERKAMRPAQKLLTVTFLGGVVGGLVLTAPAQAQPWQLRTLPVYSSGVNPRAPFYNPVAPTYRVLPGVSGQQALFTQYQNLAAAASLPPWIYGFNPYPSPINIVSPTNLLPPVPYPPAPYPWWYWSSDYWTRRGLMPPWIFWQNNWPWWNPYFTNPYLNSSNVGAASFNPYAP
jgi:hypothetical protein